MTMMLPPMTVIIPWVYGIQSGLFIKIGVTNDIGARLKQFQSGNPHPLRLVIRRQVPEAYWLEKRMHEILARHAIGREWFLISIQAGREAMKQAMDDLKIRRKMQIAWELESSARLQKKQALVDGTWTNNSDARKIHHYARGSGR